MKHFFKICSNSEADTTTNLEEMYPHYYLDSDVINIFKYSITNWCVTHFDLVNHNGVLPNTNYLSNLYCNTVNICFRFVLLTDTTIFQHYLVILKQGFQSYYEILKTCSLINTVSVMYIKIISIML